MNYSDRVDRAFVRRRRELMRELMDDGAQVIDEVVAVIGATAAGHPLAYVGVGVAAGAAMGARSRIGAPTRRSSVSRVVRVLTRVIGWGGRSSIGAP